MNILTKSFILLTALLLFLGAPLSYAQPGNIDVAFSQTGTGINGFVYALALQSDGKLVVGGSFTQYNGTTRNSVLRLNADGTLDASFAQTGTGLNAAVKSLAVQSDGKILVAGSFTNYNGTTRNRLTRLNADGTLDASFTQAGTGLNGEVQAIVVQPDGKILASGSFTNYNGTARSYVARFNTDGTLDNTFVQTGSGLNGNYVPALALQPDGKVLVGGNFFDYNGNTRQKLARLNPDGSLDTPFTQTGTGWQHNVYSVVVQPDGKILVGGAFTDYNGTPRNYIGRLNADGTLDNTFVPTGTGLDNAVTSIALQSDGKIIIGGDFTSYNGVTQTRIARLNADGTLDASFNPIGSGLGGNVTALLFQPDKKLLVGGNFGSYNGVPSQYVARITTVPAPTISSYTPTSAAAAATVTINGTNFTGATAVSFGGTAATSFNVVSATQITAVVAAGASGNVSVTTPGGTATSSGFTFIPPPTISSFTPLTAASGATVTISGTNFTGATAVSFGGVSADSLYVVSATQINAVVAASGASGLISVTTPGGTATSVGSFTFIPDPTIVFCTPSTAASGATITINGTNLTNASVVSFGGVAAASYTVVSATQITAVVDSTGASGLVSVTTPGGTATSLGLFTFIPAPTITSFTPLTAVSGATVTINGTNFTGATAVSFGGVAAASFNVISATQITAVVDSVGASGAVRVTTPGGTRSGATAFTFIPPPSITSFTPLTAASGATVTINGTNFTGATAVSFGGVAAASFNVISATQITAVVDSVGASGAVRVTAPGGTRSGATAFTFIPAPTITSFTPATAAAGATVTINGTNFTGATAVSFGGTAAASFNVISATQITAVVASGGASGAVRVTAPGGTRSGATAFTFIPPPTISSYTPTSAAAGATVTINGTDFTGATAVSFGGTAATSFNIVSATQITAVVASGASGSVSVTTPGGTATSAGFAFIPAPTISSYTPTSAAAGATVTIDGTDFTGATAVSFGGTAATSFNIVSATQITAVLAAGASGSVSVTTPGGTATSTGFIFIAPPTISSYTPASAGTGVTVTINGTNFTGATAVSFGGTAATSFNVVSATQITAVVAAGASGNVSVTALGGTITSSGFTFVPAPTISSYTPTSAGAGATVTINGANFTGATAVSFGGTAATSFNIVSATQITAVVALGASGSVSVTTPGGTVTSAGFTFLYPVPTISSYTPTSARAGGTVTINGTNFSGATAVSFGGTAATSFNIVSATQITAVVASGASGNVAVTTPGGTATSAGFTFVPGPVIASVTPLNAAAGSSVTITGAGFTGATSVDFGGIAAASFTIDSPTQITAVVGAGTSGTISVMTPGGTATSSGFVFIPGPVITDFFPVRGGINTSVTLMGYNFMGGMDVRFGGVPITSLLILSSTHAVVTVASGASGNVTVTTLGGTASRPGFTFIPPPTITSFTPTSAASGATVTIVGTDFTDVAAVSFGGVAAKSFTVVSPTHIRAVIDSGASGNVVVITTGGTVSASGFTFVPAPTITNFSPRSVTTGISVDIVGTNFNDVTSVSFGGVAAARFTVISPNLIKAFPNSNASGDVSVSTTGGTATLGGFTFISPPTITAFTPTTAASRATVSIIGTNLSTATAVSFGGVPALHYTIVSPTQIAALVSTGASGDVSVSTLGGTALASGFTFVPPPTITSFTPTSTSADMTVLITGTNFNTVTGVFFGGVPARNFTVISPTLINARVSNGLSGSVTVVAFGGSTVKAGFTYLSGSTISTPSTSNTITTDTPQTTSTITISAPIITDFSPSVCTSGTVVEITGTNFTDVTAVRFGGVLAASYQVISASRISAVVGIGTSGSVSVTTRGGTASLSGFTVIAPPSLPQVVTPTVPQVPTLTSFFPVQASSGTMVTISGTNFRDIVGVSFGGVAASNYKVISTNQIVAIVAGGGSGTLVVSSLHGNATSSGFTFLPPPIITEISPSSALRLATVTLYGANFTGATGVSFGGAQTTKFAVVSPTELVVRIPATAVSGSITVTTPNGTGAIVGFTVIDPPSITTFTPSTAATGTMVTIRGTNLTGVNAVLFGGVSASTFAVISATEIRAVVGLGASGDVTVTSTVGTTSVPGFRYIESPMMVSFEPRSAGVGTTVSIRGANFMDASSVLFGGVSARVFTVISATEIRAVVDAGASGDIVVKTPRGTASASGFRFIFPPTITAFTPASASAGAMVTISGTNFMGVTGVSFGGVTAASFTVISPTEIRAVVGMGSGGVVTVVASGGTVSSENAPGQTFVFLSPPDVGGSGKQSDPLVPPTVRGFSPTVAGKDRIVTILGTNFSNVTSVKFGGRESARFTVLSPSQLTAVVPSGASGDVAVTNGVGTGRLTGFTFVPAPMISSFTPESGAVGTRITIRGEQFSRVNRVLIGGVSVPFVVNNGGEISVTVPLSGVSSGFITLVSPGGISISSQSFEFTPPPSITSTSISQSRQGVVLRITGENFLSATTVTIGETEVAFTVLASSDMTASVPSGVLPTDVVRVFTPGGMALSVGAPALPSITGISPERGAAGTRVVVSGRELRGTTQVSIGGAVVPFAILPSGEVALTIPPSEVSGIIGLTTPLGVVTTTSSFTFIGSYPTITSFSPTRGDVGTEVRITGENLGSPLAVYIGGKSLAFRSLSPTELQVTIPPSGAVSGSVVVVTPSGIAVSDEQFVVTVGGVMPSSITTVQARCYPNPASEYVTISYMVEHSPKDVVLRIFDASGRVLNVLPQGTQEAGEHFVSMSVKNLSPGAYPVSVEIEGRHLHTVFVISR